MCVSKRIRNIYRPAAGDRRPLANPSSSRGPGPAWSCKEKGRAGEALLPSLAAVRPPTEPGITRAGQLVPERNGN